MLTIINSKLTPLSILKSILGYKTIYISLLANIMPVGTLAALLTVYSYHLKI
ncbi:MAG: hypothetical protein HOD92_07125 [Deltaproteobacteria bacterium]|jgi:hypothetical protein|nr:hypothetical protein [Deltaproteobacteria bacterium]